MKSKIGKRSGALAASAAVVLGGLFCVAGQPTSTQASPNASQTRSIKRHTTMTPQKALDKISWAAAPIIQNKWTKPTSASLTANTGKFRSDCAARTGGPWRRYELSGFGAYHLHSCGVGGIGVQYLPDRHPDMFKRPLNALGNTFIKSVGLDYQQGAKKVAGDRRKVTATYKCSAAASGTSSRGVKTIVVKKSGRATISRCPVANIARVESTGISSRSTAHHTTMTPQKALDKISWAAAPIDQNKWTKPTSASLTANTAKFKSDCAFGTGGPWKKILVTQYSYGLYPCPGIGSIYQYEPDLRHNMFKNQLNKLGNTFIRSVGLDYQQATKRIAGNRKKVTATFKCSPAATSPSRGLKTIVVRKSGRATITSCPVG